MKIDQGKIVLQQRVHRRPLRRPPANVRPGPFRRRVTAPQAPQIPRPEFGFVPKTGGLRLSAAHKGWQGAKSPGPALRCAARQTPFTLSPRRGRRCRSGSFLSRWQTWLNAMRPPEHGSACSMQQLTAGITKAGTGLDGIVWNILGQTYVPKSLNERVVLLARHLPARHLRAAAHPSDPGRVHLHAGGPLRPGARRQGLRRHRRRPDPAADADQPHGIFNKTDQTGEMLLLGVADAPALRPVLGDPFDEGAEPAGRGGAVGEARGVFLPPPPGA